MGFTACVFTRCFRIESTRYFSKSICALRPAGSRLAGARATTAPQAGTIRPSLNRPRSNRPVRDLRNGSGSKLARSAIDSQRGTKRLARSVSAARNRLRSKRLCRKRPCPNTVRGATAPVRNRPSHHLAQAEKRPAPLLTSGTGRCLYRGCKPWRIARKRSAGPEQGTRGLKADHCRCRPPVMRYRPARPGAVPSYSCSAKMLTGPYRPPLGNHLPQSASSSFRSRLQYAMSVFPPTRLVGRPIS